MTKKRRKRIGEQPSRKFGWKKEPFDPRDIKYKVTREEELPKLVDLRDKCPPVYDQGGIGSCTANALAAAYQFEEIKMGKENFIPSRLFVYYNERALEGTIDEDAGAFIRDGIKTMVKEGVCPETLWPYVEDKFKDKPTDECYKLALDNQVVKYLRISPHTVYEVKHCLAEGYPVVFGFMVYDSFMTVEVAKTGIVPIPKPTEPPPSGHAITAVGYDDDKQCFIIRNSWGTSWGLEGYFYMPYWFVETPDIASDFWTIRLVE
jgi:C1A family cysteine protease